MRAIEISRNGKKLFTAGLADGMIDARLIIRNQEDPIWFDVVGRDRLTGGHTRWRTIPLNLAIHLQSRLLT